MVSWHIEPTSKCILECPLCDRTWFYKKFKRREIHEINIEHLVNFLGKGAMVTFCGNNGDPIYHSKFLDLCKKLKSNNTQISITTNGSKKKKEWWKSLVKMLDKNDKITFSIDGLEDTNHLYRINADWQSIIEGIKIATNSYVKTKWKFIVFKHNQHQINDAEKLSKKLNIDEFKVIASDRWWDKSLMPDKKYVDERYIHQNKLIINDEQDGKIIPKCINNGEPSNDLYIDSAGNFYPCCWQGLYAFRHKDIFNPSLQKFNIKNFTASTILNNNQIKEFFSNIFNYEKVNKCCKIYCGVING